MSGAPDSFVPEMRRLGGTLVRVYVYWSQVEPEPGRYDWTVVDAILGQLDPADEVWVKVCSGSPWATRHRTGFLPSSPAHDLRRYERFVSDLVTRCRGPVDYWQCNNEPGNTGSCGRGPRRTTWSSSPPPPLCARRGPGRDGGARGLRIRRARRR
ncbi:hypothetical protein ADK74_20505 [Streptomyces decoyicus]|nr:hypothetical protein ADK74_20505 [Streptomyces decoyicus]